MYACIYGRIHVRVFVLRAEFLALLLVHVHGDGKAFPESGIADAGHCDVSVWLLVFGMVVLFVVLGRGSLCCALTVECDAGVNSRPVAEIIGERCWSFSSSNWCDDTVLLRGRLWNAV